MTIIANLDAHIEQHYAELGEATREIQIFGRVWPMIPTLTTLQLNPLMQMQAAAQIANDPNKATAKDRMIAVTFLGGIGDMLTDVIAEEEREEFREIVNRKGIPVGVIEHVIEAIMTVYDAAPFHSVGQMPSPVPTPDQPHASTTTSGPSPENAGFTSNQSSMPTSQPIPPMPMPPQQQQPQHNNGYGILTPTPPEAPLEPYQSQIPPSLAQG